MAKANKIVDPNNIVIDENLGPPSENVEDRGTLDYYVKNPTVDDIVTSKFSPDFIRQSNGTRILQHNYHQNFLNRNAEEYTMVMNKAIDENNVKAYNAEVDNYNNAMITGDELYRKTGKDRIPSVFDDRTMYVPELMSIADDKDYGEDGWKVAGAEPRGQIPDTRLKQRAAKAAVALQEDPHKMDIAMSDPEGEEQVRKQATYKDQNEFNQAKIAYLDEAIKRRDPNKPMTIEEATNIATLSQADFTPNDPNAMEKLYASKVSQSLYGGQDSFQKVSDKNPEIAHQTMDALEAFVQKKEFLQKLDEDARTDWENSSLFSKIWNIGEQIVPFKSSLTQYEFGLSSVLPGDNMVEQAQNLWMLPPEEFRIKVKQAYDAIYAHNPADASDWLSYVMSYSRADSVIASSMFGLDVATTIPIGWAGKLLKGGEKVVEKTSESAAKAIAKEAAKEADKEVDNGFSGVQSVPQISSVPGKVTTTVKETASKAKLTKTVKDTSATYRSDAERLSEDDFVVGEVDFPEDFVAAREAAKYDVDYATDGERLINGWDVGEVDFPDEFRAVQAAVDTGRELAKEEQNLVSTLAKTGSQREAVDLNIAREAEHIPGDVRDPSEFKNLSAQLSSMYNPRNWIGDGRRLTREATERVLNVLDATRANLAKGITEPGQAVRLTGAALQKAVELAKKRIRKEFRFANDGIIDTRWVVHTQSDNPETQLNTLEVTIGNVNGFGYKRTEDALQDAKHLYRLREGDYKIIQDGDYYIQVTRPIDETDPSITKAMIETDNETPKSLANTILGWFRNPDDLLSKFSVGNRKAVTHATQDFMHYFEQATKGIGRLSKGEKGRLSRLMTINRDFQYGTERGKWFNSLPEMEEEYYNLFKQYPSEKEVQAYMITRELSDYDWATKSLTVLRDKGRQGIINIHHEIKVPDKFAGEVDEAAMLQRQGDVEFRGEADQTTYRWEKVQFEGKLLDNLPESKIGDHDPGVYILREGDKIGSWTSLSKTNREEVMRLVNDEGYRVIQQADPLHNPFEAIDNTFADRQFIIMKNPTTSALRAQDMLPYKPGYHVEYGTQWFTKAGRFFYDPLGRRSYGGDTSIMAHTSEAAAKKYTKAFEQARVLLAQGDTEALKTFLQTNLPHTFEQFVRMYSDGTLDIKTPVLYTKSGQSTKDSVHSGGQGFAHGHYENSRDIYNSPYNLSTNINRQFTQEKNIALPSVKEGSEGKPVFDFSPDKLIDPLSSLSRSANRMARMRVYDNYQQQAITSWVEEMFNPESVGGSMSKRSFENARNNPIAALMDPMWEEKALDRRKLAAAKNSHRAIVQLLGVQTPNSRNIDWALNKVIDTVFDRWGDGAASKMSDFLAARTRDPAKYARAIAFHSKLGLFNPVQFPLQAQSIAHAYAITGNLKRSYQAGAAAYFMRRLALNQSDEIVKSFAKKATAFGWKEADFLESFENMKRAGVWHVEGEVADMNDIFTPKVFKGAVGRFFDKGLIFFQEGERAVRLNAWNVAYREWKAANPVAKLDDAARNTILRRYDDLAINMTRSSTGAWQKGILSIPAQFSTYQIHMMEQFLSKRLTMAEKARLFALYSVMYGLPTGAAATTAVWPWGQDIKQAALERGMDINNGALDGILNGMMAVGLEMITGHEYNVSERFGPNGLTIFKDAYRGKKGLWELMLGPSGSITNDIFSAAEPALYALMGAFRDGNDKDAYPLIVEDFTTPLRNISTIDSMFQMYYAINAGKFITKNEVYTSDADPVDAIMRGVFGLTPRAVSDAYIKIESMSEFSKAQEFARQEVIKNFKRALQNSDDPDAQLTYMKAVKAWVVMGGFRPEQMDSLIREAADGNEALVDKIRNDWWQRAPEGEQYKRLQETIERKK